MRDFSKMPEALRPQPFPALPGCSVHFSVTGLKNLQNATGIMSISALMSALLHGDINVIEEAAARGILNGDGSTWAGGVDPIPLDLMTLGRILADALHRRWFGRPLDLEGSDDE